MRLPSTRSFGVIALLGLAVTVGGPHVAIAVAADQDAARDLALGLIFGGFLILAFALAAMSVRLFCRMAARAGLLGDYLGEPARRRKSADMITLAIWLFWAVGMAIALPMTWGDMQADFELEAIR